LGHSNAGGRPLRNQRFSQSTRAGCAALSPKRETTRNHGAGAGTEKNWEPEIQKALEEDRLLIITPFGESVKRASADTAAVRNDLMISLADDVVVGYANTEGMLSRRLKLEHLKKLTQLI